MVTVQDGASSCPAKPNKKLRRFLRCENWIVAVNEDFDDK